MDVAAWLRDLGLGQYEGRFRENEIEADILPELTEADLKKLGLPLGPRKRILKAIANLGDEDKAPRRTSLGRPSPDDAAERRQLTVMFCDLAGSTALSARSPWVSNGEATLWPWEPYARIGPVRICAGGAR
jgi:class 3 adenylate cyclase